MQEEKNKEVTVKQNGDSARDIREREHPRYMKSKSWKRRRYWGKKKNWKYNNKDCFKSDVGYQTKDSKDSIKYPMEEKKTRLKYIADESINWYYT